MHIHACVYVCICFPHHRLTIDRISTMLMENKSRDRFVCLKAVLLHGPNQITKIRERIKENRFAFHSLMMDPILLKTNNNIRAVFVDLEFVNERDFSPCSYSICW